jgi:hypothetical protein
MRPLVKSLTTSSVRCFPRHHFAPPTFLPLPRVRLSPAKAHYADTQARGVYKKAVSKENKGKQPSKPSRGHDDEDYGSTSGPVFFILALFLFMAISRRRRERRQGEGQQDESAVDANGEVDFKGTGD